MEKIKLGLFDIFSFVAPGLIVIYSYFICFFSTKSIVLDLFETAKNSSTMQVFLILILAYYVGILMQMISFEVFEFIGLRFWKKKLNSPKDLSISRFENEIARIRHESPQNYDALEKWLAFRGMCYNSAFGFILLLFAIIKKSITLKTLDHSWFYILVVVVLILLSFKRAITFHEWSVATIKSTSTFLEKNKTTLIDEKTQ